MGGLTGAEGLVAPGGFTPQDAGIHRLAEEAHAILPPGDRLFGVEHHVLAGILLGRTEAPEDVMGGHVRVNVLREADPDRDLDFLVPALDLVAAPEQIVPCRRTIGIPCFRPYALQVVAGVDDPVVREAKVLARVRIVNAFSNQGDQRPVPPFRLAVDVRQIECLLLKRRWWRDEKVDVVSLLSGDFRIGPRDNVSEGDVVDGHLDALAVSPLHGHGVKPGIVRWDEVAPRHDPQFALLGPDDCCQERSEAAGRQAYAGRPGSAELEKLAPGESAPAIVGNADPFVSFAIVHPAATSWNTCKIGVER